jgi:hypothetical protein
MTTSHAGHGEVALADGRIPDPPYPGIRPFEENEWPIFFGRQEMLERLLERLSGRRLLAISDLPGDQLNPEVRVRRGRFVAIIGASGGGKSSLVKAGLFATLKHKHKRLGIIWRTATMRPGSSPMWSLAETLYRTLHPSPVSPDKAAPAHAVEPFRAGLARGRRAIAAVLEEHALPAGENLLLLIDQFEELFRYETLGGEAEITNFLDQLVDIIDQPPEGFHLALTMRSDFLGDCARYPRFADALNEASYLLRGMSNDELTEAVLHPAELLGGRVEGDLLDRMIRDAQREQDYLPLLQHALAWQWACARNHVPESGSLRQPVVLNLQRYAAVGGLTGALSHHANAIYELLGATTERRRALRFAAKRLFQSLVEAGSRGRVTRRPLPFVQIVAETGLPAVDLKEVIEAFREVGHSFLMPPRPQPIEDSTVIDISHEALIRQWDKLNGRDLDEDWLEEEQADAEIWRRLYLHLQAFGKNPRRLLDGSEIDEFNDLVEKRKLSPVWFQRYIPEHREVSAVGFQQPQPKDLLKSIETLLTDSQKRQQLVIDSIKQLSSGAHEGDRREDTVFALLSDMAGISQESDSLIPSDLVEEIERARAAGSVGWLRLLASEVAGLRFLWPALRVVAQAQWDLIDYEGARKTWERIRDNDPDDLSANLALANLFERQFRTERRPELLENSNLAIARVLRVEDLSVGQRAEAYALEARNLKSLWRLDFEGETELAKRRERATNRTLLESFKAYRRAYLVDLNHYWSGLAALQQGTIALALSNEDAWQNAFEDSDRADDYKAELKRQVEVLRPAVSQAIEAVLARTNIREDDWVWIRLSAADLMFLTEERSKRVVEAYKNAIPSNDRFAWDAAKGQLQLFALLGFRAELATEIIQAMDAIFDRSGPRKDAPSALHTIVFAGHRIDDIGREKPRFPPYRETKARDLIREKLQAALDPTTHVHVLSSAAPGSDILCHEICRELRIDSTVCLPMPKEAFSQLVFKEESWRARFLELMSSRPVLELSDQPDLPRWLRNSGFNAWERGNRWILEMALASGAKKVSLIALWDGNTIGDAPGGTAHLVGLAHDADTVVEVIDTKQLTA